MTTEFSLDPRLLADSIALGALPLCEVRLQNDVRYPWLVLVPQRTGVSELFDLSSTDQAQLLKEITLASATLRDVSQCLKINVGALGNIVRQLHIHIVARNEGDFAWPGPVWGAGARVPYADAEKAALISRIKGALDLHG
ncbi:MAG TPA: HIT family protein [Xanthobacteraceae bacterium]|nr:HIT family protein [Xanthobacteraceae bacterium]